ncbi:MAG: acetyltransferase [Balneolaceae bacterium]
MSKNEPLSLQQAETIRLACIRAAQEGFQDASLSGLCSEGAAEAAVSAIQKLDLESLIVTQDQKSRGTD